MHKPTVGVLLAGIADGLRESVMPAVAGGAAQRQLRAILHSLGRLQRSWDRWPAYLAADNEDLRATLEAALAGLTAASAPLPAELQALCQRLKTLTPEAYAQAQVPGINDPALATASALNEAFQALLAALDTWLRAPAQAGLSAGVIQTQTQGLDGLYRRMIERELQAWASQSEAD
jgi:uncharacterized coiled-coil protein SlyX